MRLRELMAKIRGAQGRFHPPTDELRDATEDVKQEGHGTSPPLPKR
jgi:hypothetical protein